MILRANPEMLQIYNYAKQQGKRIVIDKPDEETKGGLSYHMDITRKISKELDGNGDFRFKLNDKFLDAMTALALPSGTDMRHVLKTIALPEDKPVRQLTLNMPSLEHEDSPIRIELPMVCTCPHCAHKHHTHPLPPFLGGHHSPILGNQPLNPDLFDDDPMCNDEECHCNSNGYTIEDLSVADLTGRSSEEVVEDSNEEEVEKVELDKGICFDDYVSESYSNKVIAKSMFKVDTKQIMVFVTEEI